MKIFPAIDLRGGRVVRLTRGDFDRMNVYGEDPAAAARAFRAAGADCLHVVDLDGARAGTPQNGDALRAIAAVEGLFVQVGGGLRSPQAVEETLALGARRVILGTAALSDAPFLDAMLKQYGERIAVGVDARDGRVAVDGWTRTTGEDAFSFCRSPASPPWCIPISAATACSPAPTWKPTAACARWTGCGSSPREESTAPGKLRACAIWALTAPSSARRCTKGN